MFQQVLASCAGCSLLGAAKDGGQASGRPRGEVFLKNPTAYENLHDPRHLVPGEVWDSCILRSCRMSGINRSSLFCSSRYFGPNEPSFRCLGCEGFAKPRLSVV